MVKEMVIRIGCNNFNEVPALKELNDIILEKTREVFRCQLELPNYGIEEKATGQSS